MRGDEPVARFETRKAEALLVYLACNRRTHPREVLADLLWDERSQEQALSNLRVVLANLKKQLEAYLTITRESVSLNPDAQVWSDVGEIDSHLNALRTSSEVFSEADARQVEAAIDLYSGDFLEGFYVREARGFDEWLVRERERLHRLVVDALHALIGYRLQSGDYSAGMAHATRLLTLDPLDELAHQQMMQLLAYSGKRSAALTQYEACRQMLQDELGVEPSPATKALYENIRSGGLVRSRPLLRAIRGYQLVESVGTGSYGAVYRAFQPAVGREVAVKVILPQYANDPEFIRRFEVEAQIIARLEHPHIVPLYDYWREPDGAYLVMRLLKGGSLETALESGPLEIGRTLELVDQIAAGLTTAHRQGVVHRDIKPANILLDEAGNAYLSDFGIAKVLGGEGFQTQAGALFGTPAYISPEQIRSQPVTPQSDVYSLGIVLYQMLTGKAPFEGGDFADMIDRHLHQPPPYAREQRPELVEAVDQVIQCATAKEPSDRYTDALALAAALRHALSGSPYLTPAHAVPTKELTVQVTNPYKGLRAFQEADAADFFGREAMVRRLLARLAEPGPASRFLAVVGPSGSGKSSLVKAGLIPALRGGALPGSEKWFIVEMLPGSHPFEELEISLLHIASNPTINLIEQLQRDERGILRAARLALPSQGGELLLVIDQFEEVFTLVEDPAESRHFLENLTVAVTEPRGPLRVVITLRADFFDRPLMNLDLSALLQDRTELVVPLNATELESAIRSPALRVGVEMEPGLVTAMVADVKEQPGVLPLVQFALTELFERRTDHRMTRQSYGEIGGVAGVLEQRAEEAFERLRPEERDAAQQVFLRLVTLGEGVEDTRRRVLRSELEAITFETRPSFSELASTETESSATFAKVIETFDSSRLLSFDRDALTRNPTVEIAHEALLREWQRLRGWLDESRADVRMQRSLGNAASEWLKSGGDSSFLLHGARLEQFEDWAARTGIAFTREERLFLDTSLAERQSRNAAEAARKAREAALERQVRNFLRSLVVVLLLATLGSAALAWTARRAQIFAEGQSQARATQQAVAEAEADGRATQQALAEAEADARATAEAVAIQERDKAQGQADLATSRELAGMAINNLEVDPERSILLSLHALRTAYTRQAEDALHLAIQSSRVRMALTGHDGGVRSVEFSPDGTTITTASFEDEVTLWEASSGEKLFSLRGRVARYSPDGSRLVTGDEDGTVVIWDLATRKDLLTLSGHRKAIEDVHFSPDGLLLVSSSFDDTFIVWDAKTGKKIFTGDAIAAGNETLNNANFNWDGSLLVSQDFYQEEALKITMNVWNVATGQRLLNQDLLGYFYLVLSPFSRWLAAPSGNSISDIALWDLSKLSGPNLANLNISALPPMVVPDAHRILIDNFAFSQDGSMLATGSMDSTAKVWRLSPEGIEQQLILSGHTTHVWDLAFSSDGTWLATGGNDGSARIWDITESGASEWFALAAHEDRVYRFSLTADGRYLATASPDGTAKVWDLISGQQLISIADHGGPLFGVAISPDGTRLATAGDDNIAKIWELHLSPGTATAKLLFSLTGHTEGLPVNGRFPGLTSVNFSPDGAKLATGGVDGLAKVWDVESGQELLSIQTDTAGGGISQLVFSPDGLYLATASTGAYSEENDSMVRIWEVASGHEISSILSPNPTSGSIWGLAFSPDGKRIAISAGRNLLEIWDVSAGKEPLIFTGHTGNVLDVDFSPDGNYLVSASADGSARVWDVSTGEELRSYVSPGGPFLSVAFTPDGKNLIASGEGIVYGFVFDLEDLIRLAKSRLTRWFTVEECLQFLHLEVCPQP